MKFSKIRNVKSPNRGTSKSAGIDFFVPEFNDRFLEDLEKANKKTGWIFSDFCIDGICSESGSFFKYFEDNTGKFIILDPLKRILIPSGIKCNIPEGYMFCAYNKSGISVNNGLLYGAGLVDEDYTNEIGLILFNVSDNYVKIYEGQKVLQLTLLPVFYNDMEEVPESELYKDKVSERGGLGYGEGTGLF